MINLSKPQEFSAEDCAAFEAKNKSRGKVQEVKFPSDVNPDVPARFFIAKPSRQQLMAVAETQATGMEKANDLLINSCTLAGDLDQLEDDTDLYLGLLKAISELVEAKKKL